MMENSKFIYYIPDYEHSGDLDWASGHIKEICPEASNIKGFEERDYEAEADYKSEYGELDEYIYTGYIQFDAPDKYKKVLIDNDCYEIYK